ncbi:MAG: hypothetical protein ACOYJY_07810 [Acutalibacteraceae bacterium]|jgi:hypothetical protein
MPPVKKNTHRHVWINGRQMTVIYAKVKKNDPGILVMGTDVFGQLGGFRVGAEYDIKLSEEECCRGELISIWKAPQTERWEFQLLE